MSSNRTIVPNANEGKQNQSQNVKYEVAQEQGVPLNKGYNGDITAKQAGKSVEISAVTWSKKWFAKLSRTSKTKANNPPLRAL